MYLSNWSCQHICFLYFGWIYWQIEPPTEDLKENNHSSHFSVKNEGCFNKNSHSFFSQYFRQGRPLNQVILMVILTEKSKIKSIARRVRSSHILDYWIPDYPLAPFHFQWGNILSEWNPNEHMYSVQWAHCGVVFKYTSVLHVIQM